MEIVKKNLNLDFLSKRRYAIMVSSSLLVISIISFLFMGFNKGIDFEGGILLDLQFSEEPDLQKLRDILDDAGYKPRVQRLENPNEVLIRVASLEDQAKAAEEQSEDEAGTTGKPDDPTLREETEQTKVLNLIRKEIDENLSIRRQEQVGAQIGDELRDQGGIALIIALGAILIYVWLRFERRFALGAIFALIHDVVIVTGVFSLFQIQFDLTVLAALLAVIGYSLNDTIVVYDRIRENFRKMRKGTPMEVINRSLNQTLARTLMTSITTLLVLFALFFLGGEVIYGFSFALIIGVLVGTYSSIYVASITALLMGISKEDLMPVQKEGEEFQSMEP